MSTIPIEKISSYKISSIITTKKEMETPPLQHETRLRPRVDLAPATTFSATITTTRVGNTIFTPIEIFIIPGTF